LPPSAFLFRTITATATHAATTSSTISTTTITLAPSSFALCYPFFRPFALPAVPADHLVNERPSFVLQTPERYALVVVQDQLQVVWGILLPFVEIVLAMAFVSLVFKSKSSVHNAATENVLATLYLMDDNHVLVQCHSRSYFVVNKRSRLNRF
jgi:hypothetical protein